LAGPILGGIRPSLLIVIDSIFLGQEEPSERGRSKRRAMDSMSQESCIYPETSGGELVAETTRVRVYAKAHGALGKVGDTYLIDSAARV
jgi:hypothetical protein